MLRLIVCILLFFGATHQCWARKSPHVVTRSPYDPEDPRAPEEPPVPASPNEPIALPVAPPTYCSNRGRPYVNEAHYRFSPPAPDQSYNGPGLLKLPTNPGDVSLQLNPGKSYTFKFRFRSDLLEYPQKTKKAFYRIPGHEDKYPEFTNWVCNGDTSGFQPPNNGVSVVLWRGDGGGSRLDGFSTIYGATLPPFDTNTSGVYGFTYTPTSSQVGQTMEVRVVAQAGVTANERDYQQIYESDQSVYRILISIVNEPVPTVFTYQEAIGIYGNISLRSAFGSRLSTDFTPIGPADDVIKVEYYIDGVLKHWITPIKEISEAEYRYNSEYYFASGGYLDGVHQFNVRGYTQSGKTIISPLASLRILNNAPLGPAPAIFPTRGPSGAALIAVRPPTTDLSFIKVEFYSEDGRLVANGGVIRFRGSDQESWGMNAPTDGKDYAFYAIVYYNNGAKGISEVLNYKSYIPPRR